MRAAPRPLPLQRRPAPTVPDEEEHTGEHFCNACFNGEYPTGDIDSEVLERIGAERDTSRQKRFTFSG